MKSFIPKSIGGGIEEDSSYADSRNFLYQLIAAVAVLWRWLPVAEVASVSCDTAAKVEQSRSKGQ